MRPRTVRKLELFHYESGRGIQGVRYGVHRWLVRGSTVREVNIGGRLLISPGGHHAHICRPQGRALGAND
jgi:hypothetical protein